MPFDKRQRMPLSVFDQALWSLFARGFGEPVAILDIGIFDRWRIARAVLAVDDVFHHITQDLPGKVQGPGADFEDAMVRFGGYCRRVLVECGAIEVVDAEVGKAGISKPPVDNPPAA